MKWVTTWSNAISINEAKPESYGKNITLRYPILCSFNGNKIRIKLDNYTGKESIHIDTVTIAKTIENQDIDLSSLKTIVSNQTIEAGQQYMSDEIEFDCIKNESITISIYCADYISLRPAIQTMGPLSKGYYSLGNQSESATLPKELSKEIQSVYFLSDVDIYTDDTNKAILCFGDSITAQAWPEYLHKSLIDSNTAVLRKAVSGARILKEYTCIQYENYGYSALHRLKHDIQVEGCDTILLLQGINDIIHPVGTDINPFRPLSDLPTANELINGYQQLIQIAKENHCKIFIGTLLPIAGWRTYAPFREQIRQDINHWIKTNKDINGYIDFAQEMCNKDNPLALYEQYDSGDHLHPSDLGHQHMAQVAKETLEKYEIL